MLICRPFVTTRNGKRIYAASYGKKVFCWEAKDEQEKSPSKDEDLPGIKEA